MSRVFRRGSKGVSFITVPGIEPLVRGGAGSLGRWRGADRVCTGAMIDEGVDRDGHGDEARDERRHLRPGV